MSKKAKRQKRASLKTNKHKLLGKIFKLSFIIILALVVLIPTVNIAKLSLLRYVEKPSERIGAPLTSAPTTENTLTEISSKSVKAASTQATQYYLVNDPEVINHLNALNTYRAQNNLAPLVASKSLTKAAQWKADDMNNNNYFDHTDSLGRDPFQMMAAFGYNFNTGKGENIYEGNMAAYGGSGQHVVDAFKNSPSHNAIMLGSYTAVGIGRSYRVSDDLYIWTEEFGQYMDLPVTYTATPTPTLTPTSTPTPTPTPVCTITGKFVCFGTLPRICIKDKTGVIRWSSGVDCSRVGAGYTCVGGGSTYSTSSYCKPPCTITGRFVCDGTQPKICIKDRKTGLIRWSSGVNCATLGNYHCVAGGTAYSTKSYCAPN